jgi:hypothetical protein
VWICSIGGYKYTTARSQVQSMAESHYVDAKVSLTLMTRPILWYECLSLEGALIISVSARKTNVLPMKRSKAKTGGRRERVSRRS